MPAVLALGATEDLAKRPEEPGEKEEGDEGERHPDRDACRSVAVERRHGRGVTVKRGSSTLQRIPGYGKDHEDDAAGGPETVLCGGVHAPQ